MPKKKQRRAAPPVPTERDGRSRERERGEDGATPGPSAPDGISGTWK